MFLEAKYFLSSLELSKNSSSGYLALENYISEYPQSPFTKEAVNKLLSFFKSNGLLDIEISYFKKYVEIYSDDPWFLNQFSWRMTELNQNLNLALEKITHALNIINDDVNGIANIIDTKAEVLWKMGRNKEAIDIINEAIILNPENEYYNKQKEKFSK